MPGLIDSDTGLTFGEGLQFQTEIGTSSLVIGPIAPSAFSTTGWTLTPGDEEADVGIVTLPYDGGSTVTDIEYRLDGGAAVSSGGITSFTITGLTNDQEYSVELRAINALGDGAWSAPKLVTPTS